MARIVLMSISVKLCVHLSSSCIEKLSYWFLQLKTMLTPIKNLILHPSNVCKQDLSVRGFKTSTIMLFGTRYFFPVNLWLENYLDELAIFMKLCPTLLFFQENSHIIEMQCFQHSVLIIVQRYRLPTFFSLICHGQQC